jgi:predicted DNA-binding protein (MmcQ/YjbR family)
MNEAQLRKYLESKLGAYVDYPFDQHTRVYKLGGVKGKMFALIAENENPLRINLKCDPADALALRAEHKAILPGWHMNKKLWNTVVLDGSLPNSLVTEMIDQSYELIINSLPPKLREKI